MILRIVVTKKHFLRRDVFKNYQGQLIYKFSQGQHFLLKKKNTRNCVQLTTGEKLLYLLFLRSYYSTVTMFLLFPGSVYCFKNSYSIYCSYYSFSDCFYCSYYTSRNVPQVEHANSCSFVFVFFFYLEKIVPFHCSLLFSYILFLLVIHYSSFRSGF